MDKEEKDVKEKTTDTSTVVKPVESESEKALKTRLGEVSAEKQDLKEQLAAVIQTLNGLQKPKEEVEDPNVDPEILKVRKQMKGLEFALATNLDNQDKVDVQLDPKVNQKDYAKKSGEIEKLRKDLAQEKGIVYSRKELYFLLKGQETEVKETTETKETKETKEKEPMPETKTTVKETHTTPKTTEEMETDLKDVKI